MSDDEGVLLQEPTPEPREQGDDVPLHDRSFLFIEFLQHDSVRMKHLQIHNITPLQLLAMASYLEVQGKNALLKEQQDAEVAVARQQGLDLSNLR
jgi:hypothetical protein